MYVAIHKCSLMCLRKGKTHMWHSMLGASLYHMCIQDEHEDSATTNGRKLYDTRYQQVALCAVRTRNAA